MCHDRVARRGAVFAATLTALWSHAPAAQAQDAELPSFDGSVTLEGNLPAHDGTHDQIEPIYRPMTVSAQGVSCAGPGCPDPMSFVA
jgi:phosphate transport system substrate-binding protein